MNYRWSCGIASQRWLLASIFGMLICSGTAAHADNAVSRAIERAHPCSALKIKKLGITVALDQFESAKLESLKVDVNGDDASVALVGSLACRTSDAATIRGDASAKFSASVRLNLASCSVSQNSVSIIETGGAFGFAVDAFKPALQIALQNAIAEQVKALCN